MKKSILVYLATTSIFASCPDLAGAWQGQCDRDGKIKVEKLYVRQSSCEHINFYGMDYRIGMPYSEEYENKYEKTFNVHNLYWGADGNTLFFNVDRIQWMKDRNQSSSAQGIGTLKYDGEIMNYSRTYSGRDREGNYFHNSRVCKFKRI